MDQHQHFESQFEEIHIEVQSAILACHLTPAGTWLCCAEDDEPSCGHGFTIELAVANWERAQELFE